jgi:bifunctional non-homologous end joining protein LigD
VLKLRVEFVALDGEVVWLTETGVSDFDTLHSRRKDDWAMHPAFDILELDGTDLRDLPLVERKRRLKALLGCQDEACNSSSTLKVMARRYSRPLARWAWKGS